MAAATNIKSASQESKLLKSLKASTIVKSIFPRIPSEILIIGKKLPTTTAIIPIK